jgi:zinc transporter ZupT
VILAEPLLPYALGFAAGAMIFVVVEELIPECQRGGNASLATAGAMIGFAVMMVLDVAFGWPLGWRLRIIFGINNVGCSEMLLRLF